MLNCESNEKMTKNKQQLLMSYEQNNENNRKQRN